MLHDNRPISATYKHPLPLPPVLFLDDTNYSDSIATPSVAYLCAFAFSHDFQALPTTFSLSLSFQLLACCINASCLALMNAGLAMKCTVAAVRCVITESGNKILVDPSAKDVAGGDGQMEARAEFTFVFDSVERKAVSCHCTGRYSPEEFQEAMAAAKTASQEVFEFYKASLRRFTKIL